MAMDATVKVTKKWGMAKEKGDDASAVQDETKTLTKNQNLLGFKKRAGKSPSQISIF